MKKEFNATINLTNINSNENVDGNLYFLNLNQEEVLKFYQSSTIKTQNSNITFSPDKIVFTVDKQGEVEPASPLLEFNYIFTFFSQNNQFDIIENLSKIFIEQTSLKSLTIKEEIKYGYKEIIFDFSKLLNYTKEDFSTSSNSDAIVFFDAFISSLKEDNFNINLSIFVNNRKVGNYSIPFRFGNSNEMAQFALTASGIQASVNGKNGSSLIFDANGLTINNSAFKILKNVEGIKTELLSVDNKGNLIITGVINAQAGGEIGGFKITTDSLISNSGGIVLNGKNNLITAQNIKLGSGAVITDSIIFKDDRPEIGGVKTAAIYNPALYEGNFIKAGSFSINVNGVASLGNIFLDGEHSVIQSSQEFPKWYINGEGNAYFNNISIGGGNINNIRFDNGSLQAVGSTMIFNSTYSLCDTYIDLDNQYIAIEEDKNNTLDKAILRQGEWVCLVSSKDTQALKIIEVINNIDKNKIYYKVHSTLTGTFPVNETSLVVLGKNNEYILGLNSTVMGTTNRLLNPISLTISKIKDKNFNDSSNIVNELDAEKILVLGNLTGIQGTQGYGLYSQNVYLTGSLVTESSYKKETETYFNYAGINTLNGASPKPEFHNNDDSKIIFWAGAKNTTNTEIQLSPFQVTSRGSLYCKQGKFVDSITVGGSISGASLYAADIYTATIHGRTFNNGQVSGNGQLIIYDAKEGISFRTEEDDKEIFSIGMTGMQVKEGKNNEQNRPFIKIESLAQSGQKKYNIKILTDEIYSNNYFTSYSPSSESIELTENKIRGVYFNEDGVKVNIGQISFMQNGKRGYDFSLINNNESPVSKMQLLDTETIFTNKSTKFEQDVILGEKMKYEKVNQGYNLYVYSE